MRRIFKIYSIIGLMLLMTLLFFQYSFAQLKSLSLRVDGLACPFCAYGLEKKLTSLKGLESFNIHLKEGKAELVFKEDSDVDLTEIKTMVKDAGYTLRSMKITASGTIHNEEGNFLFKIKGNQNKLYIFDEHAQSLNEELRKKLEEFLRAQALIKISGFVHSHPDRSFGLAIEEYSIEDNKE